MNGTSRICSGVHLNNFVVKTGAGEGIRTLDPDLGKVIDC